MVKPVWLCCWNCGTPSARKASIAPNVKPGSMARQAATTRLRRPAVSCSFRMCDSILGPATPGKSQKCRCNSLSTDKSRYLYSLFKDLRFKMALGLQMMSLSAQLILMRIGAVGCGIPGAAAGRERVKQPGPTVFVATVAHCPFCCQSGNVFPTALSTE